MSRRRDVIYYRDELKDEFAGDHIKARKIDGSYRYIRESCMERFAHLFWYHGIAIPLANIQAILNTLKEYEEAANA